MKRKYRKVLTFGLVFVLGASMLIGCSNDDSKSSKKSTTTEKVKNNIAINGKYMTNFKNGKYGLVDFDNKQIISNKYSNLYYSAISDAFIGSLNNKYGLMDMNEKVMIPFKYDGLFINYAKDKFYASDYKTNKTTVYNLDCKEETTYDYGTVIDSDKGVKIVGDNVTFDSKLFVYNGKYGLIDSSGKEILKKEYSFMDYVVDNNGKTSEGYIAVYAEKDGKAGIFSLTGKVIIPMNFDAFLRLDPTKPTGGVPQSFNICYNSYTKSYHVQKDHKYGVYDRAGKQLLEVKYDKIQSSHNGYIVTENGKDIAFDLNGNKIYSKPSLSIHSISDNGYLLVGVKKEIKEDENTYYVDKKGKKIEFEKLKGVGKIESFSEFDNLGNAIVRFGTGSNRKIALINEKGEFVIEPLKDTGNTWITGNEIVDENLSYSYFCGWTYYKYTDKDYHVYLYNDKYEIKETHLYDKEGKKLGEYKGKVKFDSAFDKIGKLMVESENQTLYGLINREGTIVAKPVYESFGVYDDYIFTIKGDKKYLFDKDSGKMVFGDTAN